MATTSSVVGHSAARGPPPVVAACRRDWDRCGIDSTSVALVPNSFLLLLVRHLLLLAWHLLLLLLLKRYVK